MARVITIACGLFATPLGIKYLGVEGYGLNIAISSVITWLGLSNFGMAQGLQNSLSQAVATNDEALQKSLVSTATVAILGVALLLITLWVPISFYVDWVKVFPPSSAKYSAYIAPAVQITFAGFVATFLLSFIPAVYAARQEVHFGNIAGVIVAVSSLAGTGCAVVFDLGFLGLLASTVTAVSVSSWLFVIWYFLRPELRALRPNLNFVTSNAFRCLFTASTAFFVIQLCSVALFQTEPFLLMHFLSPQSVTNYNVATKLFLLAYSLFGFLAQPLWAAYGNAKAHCDFGWIIKTNQKLVRNFLYFYSFFFAFALLCGRPLLERWVGAAAAPGQLLLALVGIYFGIRMWTDLSAVLVNGLDMMRPQAISATVHTLLTLALNVFLIQRLGLIGLPVGSFLGYLLISAWALPWMARKALANLEQSRSPASI